MLYELHFKMFYILIFIVASTLLQQNVIALFEGSQKQTYACAISTVTSIPLILLHGNKRQFDQCEKVVRMSADYKDYAHATLDIIRMFRWEKITAVFDGNFYLSQFNVEEIAT